MMPSDSMHALLGISMAKRVPLIGSSLEVFAVGDVLSLTQSPFSVMVPRSDAMALAEALRAEPEPNGASARRVMIDGSVCAVDASSLRTVKTLMIGAFILALPRFAADEIAGLLELFALQSPSAGVGHA